MSLWTWLKGEESRAVKAGELEIHHLEALPAAKTIESDVRKAEEDVVADVHKVEHDLAPVVEQEKAAVRGLVLQVLNDTKAELKNAEKPLSEDAAAAVDKLIENVVQALIKDAL